MQIKMWWEKSKQIWYKLYDINKYDINKYDKNLPDTWTSRGSVSKEE